MKMNRIQKLQKIKQLAALSEVVSLLFLVKLQKASAKSKLNSLEATFGRVMFSNYSDEARDVMNKEIAKFVARKGAPKQSDVKKMLNSFEDRFGKLGEIERNTIEKYTLMMYTVNKEGLATLLKIEPRMTLVDSAAVTAIGEEQVYWVGNFYNKNLSEQIRTTVEHTMLKEGLSRSEAGKTLHGRLIRHFGIGKGKPSPVMVPPNFRGTPQDYFSGLSATVRNRATNIGNIITYQEIGVEEYEIIAVMDERTSWICQQMNGRRFTIEQAGEYVSKYLGAKTPEEIKDQVGWRKQADVEKILKAPKAKQQARLAGAGLQLPPYHFRCRTTTRVTKYAKLV